MTNILCEFQFMFLLPFIFLFVYSLITLKAPVHVWSPELSSMTLGQYLEKVPFGNTGYSKLQGSKPWQKISTSGMQGGSKRVVGTTAAEYCLISHLTPAWQKKCYWQWQRDTVSKKKKNDTQPLGVVMTNCTKFIWIATEKHYYSM